MASATANVLAFLRSEINGGLRHKIERLIPEDTGDLSRSLRIRAYERDGAVVLRVELLDYFRYQKARGLRGRNLVGGIGSLMLYALRPATTAGMQAHFFQTVKAWDLPMQKRVTKSIPGTLRITFAIFLHNNGRPS